MPANETLSEDLVTALREARKSLEEMDATSFDGPPAVSLYMRAADEIERLRSELAEEKHRSFQDSRISYRGFSYGVGSQWGIDSLRRAIERNEHG